MTFSTFYFEVLDKIDNFTKQKYWILEYFVNGQNVESS